VTNVNFRPYKCITQYIIANASFPYVSYFTSLSVNVREAYAIDWPLFIFLCDKIALTAILEASVVKIKGFEKSGYCKTGSSHNLCFNVSNDSS